ncbi:hypothetical protein [Stieleria varia]|uniref:Transmembrane protein n=1 Tax=Stieleria varia TaxID=2528005 RepID=A0A5C6ASX3_9BACT|nr:hypothetical protein [Stieleria varia]TWU02800.1 hypothetical protein Pla52n_38590 [Stieleria varia]
MARKQSKTRKSSSRDPDQAGGDLTAANTIALPSEKIRWALSVWLIVHLGLVAISFAGVVQLSGLQSAILDTAAPYLESTHFAAGGRPYYLAHGDPDEQPHRLQVSTSSSAVNDESLWSTVEPFGAPGMAGNDRYARWFATAATLAEAEQPSLVAQLLLPIVESDDSIAAIRIVRLPTQLTTAVDDSQPPPYVARVARKNGRVSLVQLQASRLTTMSNQSVGSDEALESDDE